MVRRGQRRTKDGKKRLNEDSGLRAEARGGQRMVSRDQRMVSRGERRTQDGEQRPKQDKGW